MYRVYWIENGQAREEFCNTKDVRDTIIEELTEKGIDYGWNKI
jgi:hypothetical protein